MARNIAFRAWHKQEEKMFDVLSIDLDAEFGGVWKWGKVYHAHDTGEQEADKEFIGWEHIELMQVTDYKDKHGKEIYVDDIVRHSNGMLSHIEDIHDFCGDAGIYGDYADEVEIIGNIWENSDLLKCTTNSLNS